MTAATQYAARLAAFDAIAVAERHLALGARSAAQLEHLADAILDAADAGPTAALAATLAEARAAKARQAQTNRIDRFTRRLDLPATRADVVLAGRPVDDLLALALAAPVRRSVSRAERREATRLADKTLCRAARLPKRQANALLKAQRSRIADLAAGTAAPSLPSNPFLCTLVPTRSVTPADLRERLAAL